MSTQSSNVQLTEGADAVVLRVQLLGSFQVVVGERVCPQAAWRLRKASALVKMLALAPHFRLHREEVLNALWPDHDPRAAANNLHYALHVARRVLDPLPNTFLRLQGQTLSLGPPESIAVDALHFEECAAQACQNGTVVDLRNVLDRYSGELLPEDLYEDWTSGWRAKVSALRIKLLQEVARRSAQQGDHVRAIDALRQVIALEPMLEEAHAALMQLYASIGQRELAIRQYEQLRATLRRELDVEPDPATEEVYQRVRGGQMAAATAAPSPPGIVPQRAHNLPTELTSFIGRTAETAQIQDLCEKHRLVTLIGPGGAGKTRLASHVARRLAERSPGGVWLVELASTAEPELVPAAVASVLSIHEQQEQPLCETLIEALESKQMMLVLDNCEHLVSACAQLVDAMLKRCAQIRILATSREPLGVAGEVIVTVPPLRVPGAQRSFPADELLAFDAVRLLTDRIRYRQPTFVLSDQHAPALAAICRQLEGIPLAIELAAARVGSLSLEQIAEHLSDAPRLLTSGSRTSPVRQRTLRATLDWSYDLLREREQLLFARLSVFLGGWTLASAVAVGGAENDTDVDVLDGLSRLVDKSLVVAEPQAQGEIRYRLLEPIRQYAAARLKERGEAREVKTRHAMLFLSLAQRAEAELRGPAQIEWLARLETEYENLRAALHWALDAVEEGIGLKLVASLWLFWYVRGHVQEGERWLTVMLSYANGATKERAEALRGRGAMAYKQRQYDQAIVSFEEALALFRTLGDRGNAAACLGNVATVVQDQGDLSRAMELQQQALVLRRQAGDKLGAAITLSNIGVLFYMRDDLERARSLFEESLTLYREIGDTGSVAIALNNLGELALRQGQAERANEMFREGLSLGHAVGETEVVASCLDGLAVVAAQVGRLMRGARLYGAADAVRRAINSPLRPQEEEEHAARKARVCAALGQHVFEQAVAEGAARMLDDVIQYALGDEDAWEAPPDTRTAPITGRERDVAALIASGLTNREIAGRLGIGERSVETYVRRAMRKLNLASRAQLAAWIALDETQTSR